MSQDWDLDRAQKEFRKHEILKSADKLSYIYPLEEKRARKQNQYYKNRRTKNTTVMKMTNNQTFKKTVTRKRQF